VAVLFKKYPEFYGAKGEDVLWVYKTVWNVKHNSSGIAFRSIRCS